MVYASSSAVYEVGRLEHKTQLLQEQIARNEAQHFVTIQTSIDATDHHEGMAAYSPQDNHVRYARVGNAVYSLLDTNRF